jgi:hypothetical protein
MKTKKRVLMFSLAIACSAVMILTMSWSAMAGMTIPGGTAPHGYVGSKLSNDSSWGGVCGACHKKKHQKACLNCHGPGGKKDVHNVSRHSNCLACHAVLAEDQTLVCSDCHTVTRATSKK